MRVSGKIGSIIAVGLALIIVCSGVVYANENIATNDNDYDQYLIKALNDDNVGIRSSAAQLLGQRKCKEAVEPLKEMLKKDKFYANRIVAALALHEIGDDSAYDEITKLVKKDRNRTVRHVLAGIIQSKQSQYLANK